MKYTIAVISLSFILLLSGCAAQTPNSSTVQLDGISFSETKDYPYTFQETEFTSFEEYANDMESNFIRNLIESNNQEQLSESEVQSELERFEGRYSFERKKINSFDALVHRRDFFGMIGDIYKVDIYVGNGKVLSFSDEFDHARLDKALSTIGK